jgi:hypothetical protein
MWRTSSPTWSTRWRMRRTYFALTPCVPLSREAGEGEPQGAPPCAPTPLLKGVGFFSGVLAHGVAEQGISASMRARRSRSQHALRWERGRPARNPDHARKKPTPLSYTPLPPCGRGAGGELIGVHRFGTESLRQGRFSPRGREQAGAPFCPHPLCPPLPRGGRGGTAGRTAVRPTPLSHAVGEGLGVRAKKARPFPYAANSSAVSLPRGV